MADATIPYALDAQVGYLLRLASQRHSVLFQIHVPDGITPTQFSALIRIAEARAVSQNQLGRLAAMDVATIKGVVDRLRTKGLAKSHADPVDKRRMMIALTPQGIALIDALKDAGTTITDATLAPLSAEERNTFLELLKKLS